MKRILFVTCILVLGFAGGGWGAVWYVSPAGSDLDTGLSWDHAFQTIQTAVDVAREADEIWVQTGTYLLENRIVVRTPVAIYGGFSGTEARLGDRDWKSNVTAIDGNDRVSCFDLQADATIDGFVIRNGESAYFSGGINVGSGSSPVISNCTFYRNSSPKGGAIYNAWSSSPTIVSCTFRENRATRYDGGAIYNYYRSSPIILNCTFQGNTAERYGGAIHSCFSSPIITNCTFYGNGAGLSGGGIYNYFYSSPTITNCIFWDNQADSGLEIDGSVRGMPKITYSDIRGGHPGLGNINAAPDFVDPDEGDFHLERTSVCMDAGDQNAPYMPVTDFEGDPRVFGDKPDMGVDEVAISSIEVCVDIKPGSCLNRVNVKSRGVLPVAVLGTDEFDVAQIDPASIRLEGVSPLRWALEDVGAPLEPITGKGDTDGCNKAASDGFLDLTLKFDTQEVLAALGSRNADKVVLELNGRLEEKSGSTQIVGEDAILILKNGKK